ncbi:HAD family phosphatase [Phormidium pseudopriestleyi FRX01]|uniref:HAD family phosphatase n=1 Tax=Phormidium pseudopriestleyi FRX01 TaxID=1759528 RepID=A0ABS3FWB5_9CYAN|nr:HAD family phosphatase [Phormidium pseudopriestleyi]MBO0351410.1 HAD family phosphatase [Phormidium pseudopriestleyi FRX01]
MSLKAILFDFNGVIINDESIHEELINELLLAENLRPKKGEFWQICLGRSDRACIAELFALRGRFLTEEALNSLIACKAIAYQERLATLNKLPIFLGVEDLIFKLRGAQLKLAVVSGALRSEVELVLNRANMAQHFSAIVAGDDISASKPEPDGYLLAVERLNQQYPELNLTPRDCLAIEDTPAGIQAAQRAGIQVVGIANTYPFHMLQRQADWTVDDLRDVELDRLKEFFQRCLSQPIPG